MTTSSIHQKIAHEKWVQSRNLISVNRIRSAAYFAFNVWRNRYGCGSLKNDIPNNGQPEIKSNC